MPRKPGPLQRRALQLLQDGQWHDAEAITVKLMNSGEMLPGEAIRKYEAVLANSRKKGAGGPPQRTATREQRFKYGARSRAADVLRSPWIEARYEEQVVDGRSRRRKLLRLKTPVPDWLLDAEADEPPPTEAQHAASCARKGPRNGRWIDREKTKEEITQIVRENPGVTRTRLYTMTTVARYLPIVKACLREALAEGLVRVEPPHRRGRLYPPREEDDGSHTPPASEPSTSEIEAEGSAEGIAEEAPRRQD